MHTPYTTRALSFMALDHPTEQDINDLYEALTPMRTRDEGITARNMAFRLTGKTTGHLHIESADPVRQSDEVWYPSAKFSLR